MVTDLTWTAPGGKRARAARSLVKLRDQINAGAPKRSRRSDGMVGDLAHSQGKSDHNPNGRGVVTAFDITHDPSGGVDCEALYRDLVRGRDPRIKYIIWRSTITSASKSPWVRRRYTGANKHDKHLHLSVEGDYDSTRGWVLPSITGEVIAAPAPKPEEDDDMTPEQATRQARIEQNTTLLLQRVESVEKVIADVLGHVKTTREFFQPGGFIRAKIDNIEAVAARGKNLTIDVVGAAGVLVSDVKDVPQETVRALAARLTQTAQSEPVATTTKETR